jgi:predicted MPP superfamily phosphohydrolase
MIYLYCFLAIAALWLAYMRFEAGNAEVVHVRFTKSKRALKIIQLSDIHISRLKVSPERVKKVIEAEKPDFVIITGDYIDKISHIPSFLTFLDSIKGGCKMLLCLGNHDHKALLGDDKGREGGLARTPTGLRHLRGPR